MNELFSGFHVSNLCSILSNIYTCCSILQSKIASCFGVLLNIPPPGGLVKPDIADLQEPTGPVGQRVKGLSGIPFNSC